MRISDWSSDVCSSDLAGTWHVRIKGYSAFSGVSIVGDYDTGGGGGGDAQTYSNSGDYAINNNATVYSPITVSGRSGNASTSTSVSVDIKHTYIGDLKVDLLAPDGSVYGLHNRTGGSANNIIKTYPGDLSVESLHGTWRLRVTDSAWGDPGKNRPDAGRRGKEWGSTCESGWAQDN